MRPPVAPDAAAIAAEVAARNRPPYWHGEHTCPWCGVLWRHAGACHLPDLAICDACLAALVRGEGR
jgi:hypothetical protein